ncbi:MAG: helix-turn-helix domain-containing protein [Rikenellaceae bacterium]
MQTRVIYCTMNFGEIIKNRRSILGISQQDLADISGVGLRTIKMIEVDKGNPSVETLQKIGNVLGLELTFQLRKNE